MTSHEECWLVTGGAGFIGSNFVDLAIERGWRVVVVDKLTYAGRRENLRGAIASGRAQLIEADICDGGAVSQALAEFRPTAVINFAAESHVDRSILEPSTFIHTNIVGTLTLLAASLEHWRALDGEAQRSFRYLQVSTDEVFGALGPTGTFSETSPKQPNSPYAASKAGGDHLVSAWHHTYGLPTLITNCSNNYGPRQYPEKLIPRLITAALDGGELPVYGDGCNVRDWIHVVDHCEGILLMLSAAAAGSTYCFGGNAERRNIDLVRTFCRILDEKRPRTDGRRYEEQIRFVEDRAGHDWRYAIDDSKARAELGFKRRYDFDTGLATTVDWYLNNEAWWRPLMTAEKKTS